MTVQDRTPGEQRLAVADAPRHVGTTRARGLEDARLCTPCLAVDRTRVERNVSRLRKRLAGADVVFRPHLKTIKSYDAALLAMASPAGPAAVSTLREAEEFGSNGVTDILYAVGIAPQKLARASAIRRSGVDLKLIVDSVEAARAVAEHAASTKDRIPVYIEVDVDGHRAGIGVDEADYLVELGPGAGEAGGKILYQGDPGDLLSRKDSPTAPYLREVISKG